MALPDTRGDLVQPVPPGRPRRGFHRALESFHHRDFRIFYIGQLISVTGTWIQSVAQGWLVLVLSGSPFLLGLTSAVRSIPVLVLSFPAGVVADRLDRRRVILAADVAAMVLSATLAALTALGRIDVTGILVLAALLGVANAFEMPARQSYIVELTGPRHLANAIALNSLLFNSARVVGPALAGVIIGLWGAAAAFALNAASYLAIVIGLLAIRSRPVSRPAIPVRGAFGEAFGYLRRTPLVASLLGLLAANTVFASGYLVVGPALARDLGQGATGLGLLLAAPGLGAVVAGVGLAAVPRHGGRGKELLVAGLVVALSLVGVGLVRSFPVTLVLLAATGWGMVTYTATSNTLIQLTVPDALRGRIMSLYTIVMLGFMPVAGLFAGALAERSGSFAAVGLGAAIWGLIVAAGFALQPALRSA
ncbi:MAG TPA: MFS transporter [Candidatus Limnocylindrales bacterium]|nr:MFS transporter [Candidatus Limnocylindrales bacterium]